MAVQQQMMNDDYEISFEKPLSLQQQQQQQLMGEEESAMEVKEITDGTSLESLQEPQQKISFYPEVDVYEISNREDRSEEEYYLCFYSPDEITWTNEELHETADRMESGKKAKKSKPYRGLEAWTQRGRHEMNQRVFSYIDSVLDEQEKQRKTSKPISTRKIAKACRSLTKTSKTIALELAKQDEKEACKVYEEDINDDQDAKRRSLQWTTLLAASTYW